MEIRLYLALIWGLRRNDSIFEPEYHLSTLVPIFQREMTEDEGAGTMTNSKTLLIDDSGEESDLTIVGSRSV